MSFLKVSGKRPEEFHGKLKLPPSKSYLHRAFFIASLAGGKSGIRDCGKKQSDDVVVTIRALRSLGIKITQPTRSSFLVLSQEISSAKQPIFVGGSGTTARFLISFAALAQGKGETKIVGDASLSRRPMQPLLNALSSLGVECHSDNGRLPVVVKGGGIQGGTCKIDGSTSSQFLSSLLIACTKARNDCLIEVEDPLRLVSEPYVEATLKVLKRFGFNAKVEKKLPKYLAFRIRGNQKPKGTNFAVPGDMSSAASVICSAISSQGQIELLGVNHNLPQADSLILDIAKKFGAQVSFKSNSVNVRMGKIKAKSLKLDLNKAPDLVPVLSGLAAAVGCNLKICNIGHLRFKESDRIHALARELSKLGIKTSENKDSLSISNGTNLATQERRKPIVLDPENDHRILMALTVAGLSGRFGELRISNPGCVNKSYPNFVSDIRKLCHESLLGIVRK